MSEVATFLPCDCFKIELIVEPQHKDRLLKELHKLGRAGLIQERTVKYTIEYADGEMQ